MFTRERGAEERTSRERFLDRAGRGLLPRWVTVVPHHALATSGAIVTDTGVEDTSSWLVEAAWSPVDEALAYEARQEVVRRELTSRLHARIGELKRHRRGGGVAVVAGVGGRLLGLCVAMA